ncbi:MAG TPA: hypothetical protein VHS56_12675, partial [Candidatus Cybelea sp.]|nr:hypothetical protein [Candidatus Cybelea sp.]
NVAGGVATPIGEILGILLDAARLSATVTVDRTYSRASDMPRAFASIARLRAAGYVPAVSLAQSLTDVLDYYRRNLVTAEAV